MWHEVMVNNTHALHLWRTKPVVLAGDTQLTGNCVENWCKVYTIGLHQLSETDMYSRFSGRKQTNKQKKNTRLRMACLTFQLLCVKKWFSTGNYIHYTAMSERDLRIGKLSNRRQCNMEVGRRHQTFETSQYTI